jgi:hypothetical protein
MISLTHLRHQNIITCPRMLERRISTKKPKESSSMEEHYLNGRLKTVTAYLGSDYSALINDSAAINNDASTSGDEA